MYEAAASCKDIARAPVRNWGNPRCNSRRILLLREARDESSVRNAVPCHLHRNGVTVHGNVTSVYPPLEEANMYVYLSIKQCFIKHQAVKMYQYA